MHRWLNEGYFNLDVEVCKGNGQVWVKASTLFRDPSVAFMTDVQGDVAIAVAAVENILKERGIEIQSTPEEGKRKTADDALVPLGWTRYYDEESKRPYFFHADSCISSWEHPADLTD